MKRLLSILLSLMLCLSMFVPQIAFADEVADTQAAQTEAADVSEMPANDVATDPTANAPEEPAEEPAENPATEPETPEAPETPAYSFDPYRKVIMTELYDANKLVLPEGITAKKATTRDGLLLNGTAAAFNSEVITIADDFNFDRAAVGRIMIDGLSDRDASVYANIFLDDSSEPVTSIKLRKQSGKIAWNNDGDLSADVMELGIQGTHNVSLGFSITGIKDTKKTTVDLRAIEFCECTLPVMYFHIDETEGTINAMNQSEDHSVECYGSVDLIVPDAFNEDETFRDEYAVQDTLKDLRLEYIRGRGNSTWSGDKKPYKVKFDKKQNLFGFGANKHWVLLANRYDNSLVRNRMTYWLGQQLGLQYTPQCVPVEVVMNGEYYGSYLLSEQIRVGEGRVEIDDLEDSPKSDDPFINSGGYLLSMGDGETSDDPGRIRTKHDMWLYIESPSFEEEVNTYQIAYIKAFLNQVEDALYGTNFTDPQGHSFTDYLDMDAAVDYWWVQEFSANGDAFGGGSTYLYKKRDVSADQKEKLYWGPLWDFDYVAWGDLEYDNESYAPEGLNYTQCPWFDRLKGNKDFLERVKARWSEEGGLRDQLQRITEEGGLLDKYEAQMLPSYTYDHEKYGSYDEVGEETNMDFRSYSDEISQLRRWILQRMDNVDEAVSELEVIEHNVKFVLNGKTIEERSVLQGSILGATPVVPEKKGYIFDGWYTEDSDVYDAGTYIFEDLVLTARYIKEDKAKLPEHLYFESYDVYSQIFPDEPDESIYFGYKVMPEDASGKDVTWTSSDEAVASFNEDGELIAHTPGEAVITGTLSNGVTNSFKLHLYPVDEVDFYAPEEIALSKSTLKLEAGRYTQLRADVLPKPSYIWGSTWVSIDPDIASVDDLGIVTANKPGSAIILYMIPDSDLFASCKVTVTKTTKQLIKDAKARKTTLKGKAVKGHKVRLTWKKSKGASGYVVYRAAKKNGKYTKVATIKKGSTVKWTSKKLKRGKKYFYKIRPFTKIKGKTYYGKWSNKKAIKTR